VYDSSKYSTGWIWRLWCKLLCGIYIWPS